MGRSASLALALALAPVALLLSSCQVGANFQYVSHRAPDGVDLYFKVPAHWSIFDTKAIIEAQNGKLGPTQLKQIENGEWIEGLSPRPGATAKSAEVGQRYPAALVEVQRLGVAQRDGLNFSAMRSLFLQTDPLTAASGFQVLSYNEFTAAGGIHGIKMLLDITNAHPVITFGQVTAVDANTNWIFAAVVSCHASCWGQNAGAIRDLLSSWTLKEQSP